MDGLQPVDSGGSLVAPLRPLPLLVAGLAIACVIAASYFAFPEPMLFRAAAIAGTCLVLWLTEVVPLYATTLLLWVGVVALLEPMDPNTFSVSDVLASVANPVMALFFGGFALSAAGSKYGIDAYIAGWMVRASRGRRLGLLLALMVGTATLSMWMSNIAAAAMMFATLRPLFRDLQTDSDADQSFRKALLLGIAFAANFGGIGTPIGSGPNLIAIGAIADRHRITFFDWVAFAAPLAGVMVLIAFAIIAWQCKVRGRYERAEAVAAPLSNRGWSVVAIFTIAVLAWLLEPVHGVPAAFTALAVAAALFSTRLLSRSDLHLIEWDTLLLIAGGLTLGELFHASGLAAQIAGSVDWNAMPRPVLLVLLVLSCALISAVASNTAATAMLVQIAIQIVPSPAVAVIVALGASMGVPFVISTPPNSMAYGQGGIAGRDLFVPGLILMLIGCALVAFAGPPILKFMGVP